VAQYSIESGEDKPVTAARKFIQAGGILPPALLLVKQEVTLQIVISGQKGTVWGSIRGKKSFLVS